MASHIVARYANDKTSMYNAVYRNNFLLPPKHDTWLTFEFLDRVRTGLYWSPKISECKLYSCLEPPNKDELAEIVAGAIEQHVSKY